MCGICGFYLKDGAGSQELLDRMNNTLYRRGPDGAGSHYSGRVGLAMRRLAIIDIAGGQQPIFNEDKTIISVYNGEIYNFQELRAKLIKQGHNFRAFASGREPGPDSLPGQRAPCADRAK